MFIGRVGFGTVVITLLMTGAVVVAQDVHDPSPLDLWDVSNGITIVGNSTFDQSPPGLGYDARDVFGGMFTAFAPERGDVVFDDGQPAGYVDYIQWRTPRPTEVSSFTLVYAGDYPVKDWRNLAHFTLQAQDPTSGNWQTIYDADTPQQQVGPVSVTSHVSSFFGTDFRAMFTRGPAESLDGSAPRIIELDAAGICFPDTNLDGRIDFTDLLTLVQHYGQNNQTISDGSFDGSGEVNFTNLLILAQFYGKTDAEVLGQPPALAAAVPEPATGMLAVCGLGLALIRCRQRY